MDNKLCNYIKGFTLSVQLCFPLQICLFFSVNNAILLVYSDKYHVGVYSWKNVSINTFVQIPRSERV